MTRQFDTKTRGPQAAGALRRAREDALVDILAREPDLRLLDRLTRRRLRRQLGLNMTQLDQAIEDAVEHRRIRLCPRLGVRIEVVEGGAL